MGIFGWDYPPGAANDPNAPWNQIEGPCDICAQDVDSCICPECPFCGGYGDPACYLDHGLRRSEEQKFLKEIAERQWAEAARLENLHWDRMGHAMTIMCDHDTGETCQYCKGD